MIYQLNLDVKKSEKNKTPIFTLHDKCTLKFTLKDDGVVITDMTDLTMTIKGVVTNPFDISSLEYTFDGSIKTPGIYYCNVQIYRQSGRDTTWDFYIEVREDYSKATSELTQNIDVTTDIYNKINTNKTTLDSHTQEITYIKTKDLSQDELISGNTDNIATHTQEITEIKEKNTLQDTEISNKLDLVTLLMQIIKGEITFEKAVTFLSTIHVTDIVQNGTTYETHAEQLYTEKDYIILRDKAIAGLLNGTYAGLRFKSYDGTNDGYIVIDNNGILRIGDENDLQTLLTREDNPLNEGVLIFDTTTLKAITISINDLLDKATPVYSEIAINEPIITLGNTKEKLAELQGFSGESNMPLTTAEADRATWAVDATIKNEVTYSGQYPLMNELCMKRVFVGASNETWFTQLDLNNDTHMLFYISYENIGSAIKSNLFTFNNSITLKTSVDEGIKTGYPLYKVIYLRIEKSKLLSYDVAGLKQWLAAQSNAGTPLTVYYELAVKNPKEKLITSVDLDRVYNTYVNVDYVWIAKPTDYIGYNVTTQNHQYAFSGYITQNTTPTNWDSVDNVGKIFTSGSTGYFWLGITKNKYADKTALVNDVNNGIIGKTLTYQLATPRLAEVTGIESVVNPNVEIVGVNLFDGTLFDGYFSANDVVTNDTKYVYTNYIRIKSSSNFSKSVSNNYVLTNHKFYDINKTQITTTYDSASTTTTSKTAYIRFIIRRSDSAVLTQADKDNIKNSFILNLGTTALAYTPYSKTYTQLLADFGRVGTVSDKAVYKNGLWYKQKYICDDIALGSKNWQLSGMMTNTYVFFFEMPSAEIKNTVGIIPSILFKQGSAEDIRHWYFGGNATTTIINCYFEKYLIDSQTGATLVDKLKAYLTSINAIFIGELTIMVEEEINTRGDLLKIPQGATVTVESNVFTPLTLKVAENYLAMQELLINSEMRSRLKIDKLLALNSL